MEKVTPNGFCIIRVSTSIYLRTSITENVRKPLIYNFYLKNVLIKVIAFDEIRVGMLAVAEQMSGSWDF